MKVCSIDGISILRSDPLDGPNAWVIRVMDDGARTEVRVEAGVTKEDNDASLKVAQAIVERLS